MANNGFVLVPKGCGSGVTDMDKKRLENLTERNFQRQWNQVLKYFQSKGGCEAVIWYDNGSKDGAWEWSRNIPMGYHAEENLFVKRRATALTVKAMLITIEPCRYHRYGNGHNCYEFFKNGRNVDGQPRRFVPASPDTPVFYLEDQPASGDQSKVSRSLARLNRTYVREYLANLGGVQWGLAIKGSRTKLWSVGGQEVMEAQEIVNSLKRSDRYHKWTADEWNPEKCDPEVQAEVRRLLSA